MAFVSLIDRIARMKSTVCSRSPLPIRTRFQIQYKYYIAFVSDTNTSEPLSVLFAMNLFI